MIYENHDSLYNMLMINSLFVIKFLFIYQVKTE